MSHRSYTGTLGHSRFQYERATIGFKIGFKSVLQEILQEFVLFSYLCNVKLQSNVSNLIVYYMYANLNTICMPIVYYIDSSNLITYYMYANLNIICEKMIFGVCDVVGHTRSRVIIYLL